MLNNEKIDGTVTQGTITVVSEDKGLNETVSTIKNNIKNAELQVNILNGSSNEIELTSGGTVKSELVIKNLTNETLKDMMLEKPEIIKQGTRYGVRLKAKASSIHMIKVDVESTFEPIIGTEVQSKELIDYIMRDYNDDPTSIWKSEIFGRSLDEIVKEGIQTKLMMMKDSTRYKLSSTVSKIVNKGSDKLIAIVL